eukprot:5403716-Pyramimonas_sp.AAC.1
MHDGEACRGKAKLLRLLGSLLTSIGRPYVQPEQPGNPKTRGFYIAGPGVPLVPPRPAHPNPRVPRGPRHGGIGLAIPLVYPPRGPWRRAPSAGAEAGAG